MNKILILLFFIISPAIFGQTSKSTVTTKPFVLGVIEEIDSKELGEKRIINIYFPEGYNPAEATRYPVIYLLDGSADEDFIHIAGLVQFNSFEWVNHVPKSIVVGIATVDRRRDFTFPTTILKDKKAYPTSGHSAKFISFIEKELQPIIEKKYKTNNSKTIIGQSLGGLLETEILFTKPSLFNKYIIISPSLWWDNGCLLNEDQLPLLTLFKQPIDIYIAVGKEGITPTEIPRVMEVDANLLAEKIKSVENKNINVHFEYLPLENHGTILHQAVSNAFRALYPKENKE
ncbi:alpha/beta hydrolase [Flavobacterium sp. N1736]|uniref:alpha/beta hydrolase n=1 Tax=Flavobacterium sp. N1736 TaxID=2986823 RepID=UPI0022240FAA|nr:alpha/beta hydrolase-fold protein [Flavobacterium sp. N1736]